MKKSFSAKVISANYDCGFVLVQGDLTDGKVTVTLKMLLHASTFEKIPKGTDQAIAAEIRTRSCVALAAACPVGKEVRVTPEQPPQVVRERINYRVKLAA